MRTLEEFFQALEEQFQLSDAIEQVIVKWVTLKQTNTVTIYMNEVDALHNTWALGEQAEFHLAFLGMKKELKGVIRRALKEKRQKWTTL